MPFVAPRRHQRLMEMIDDAAVAMRTTDIEKILSEITYSYTYINVLVPIILCVVWLVGFWFDLLIPCWWEKFLS